MSDMADIIERIQELRLKERRALRTIESMPATMVNDSESLRHMIKTLQQIARNALTTEDDGIPTNSASD